jgi:hypothetical protein
VSARQRLDAVAARLEEPPAARDELIAAVKDYRYYWPEPHLLSANLSIAVQMASDLQIARTDLAAMHAALTAVLEVHKPFRTHNPISNPDFYYQVCATCVDPEGDDMHLWPCPTVTAVEAALQPKEEGS